MKNKYEVIGKVVVVYALWKGKEKEFYFDVDMLPKLKNKNVTFSVNTDGYLYWSEREGGKRKSYTTHRHLVFNDVQSGVVVDHINGNRNDNQKSNLRLIEKRLNNSLGYITNKNNGKYYSKQKNGWEVRKSYNGKQIRFGYFEKEETAKKFVKMILSFFG